MAIKRTIISKPVPCNQLQPSKVVRSFDIPLHLIEGHMDNPNEMSEATFDELVEGIRKDGFDEPCLVVPKYDDNGKATGRYIMASGHHRMKAVKVLGWTSVPCVIKEGWNEFALEAALVRRNMLRGEINATKFTALYNKAIDHHGMDREMAKRLMGITDKKIFEKLYLSVKNSLTPKHRAMLESSEEKIESVDDLSSTLNRIFRESGSQLEQGYLVFNYGGKSNSYYKVGKDTETLLRNFDQALRDTGKSADQLWAQVLSRGLSSDEKTVTVKPSVKPRPHKG